MGKVLKKVLSLLIICSLVLTTSSMATLADGLNNETTKEIVETTAKETTTVETTIEETTGAESLKELNAESETTIVSEEEETTDYEEEPEEETTVEEPEFDETETTAEETTVEETTTAVEGSSNEETDDFEGESATSPSMGESHEPEEKETTIEETTVEETTTEETIASELDKKDALLGDGENHTFTFKMQDDFGWYNSEDGDTTIEYDSSDDIVIPVVYPAGGHSAGYVWIDYGWAKDEGGHSGPTMTENQLQELINNWKTNPTEDIAIYPNFEHFYEGNIKTPPSKLNYTVGQDIDPAGIVFELTKDDKKKEVPYALPQYARLYSREILDADKNPIGWDTVTADAKYCRFHFDDMIYQDVELTVNVPHTFTFVTNERYPEDFGYFDADHTINVITYHSEELDTKPIEIPLVYNIAYQDTGAWIDIGWLLYKGEHTPEEWLSDDQLSTLVENWKNNPTEDVKVRVSFEPIYHSSLKQAPNKIAYKVGEEIDPTGLVIEVSNEIFDPPTWTKDIAYDAIQYKDLFAREILDADKKSLGWDKVTADTKYCRFHFKTSVYEDVELDVTVPHTFKFVKDTKYKAWFNQEDGPAEITFKSEELDTNPVVIPKTYISDDEGGQITVVNVGWRNKTASEKWISDDELRELVYNWSKNPNEDIVIAVNFDMIGEASVKTPPNKVDYFAGDEFDPSGLVMYLGGGYVGATWTVEVAYDAPEYQRIIGVQLYDNNNKKISGKTITEDTKFVRYIFNSGPSVDVNINLRTPKMFTFEVSDSFAHFNAEDGPTTVEYKSEELDKKAIRIPAVYMNRAAAGDININVGWINNSDGDKKITNAELEKIVVDWTKNPDRDMKISVNFESVEEASAKVLPRVEYWLGDTFEPWEFVLEVSDSNKTWTKDIPLDSPEYGRLYTYKLLDENKQEVSGFDITLDTKYCSITYDDTITEEFDIIVLKEVKEILLKQPQDWKEYSTGEKFDPRGLEIHVTYVDDEEEDIAYNDRKLLFLFNPFYLTEGTNDVTVIYGGKTTTTHVTMVDKVYVLYYYNKDTNSVHSIYTYPGDENNVLSALDNAVSSGAKGFYRVDAKGFYDGYNKYNKDTESTLTKYQALSVYTEEYDGNESIYIGAAFIEPPAPPEPTPKPRPTPYNPGGGSSGGGGSSSPTVGPMGDLTKNPLYQQQLMQQGIINSTNNIPQNNLIANTQLAATLLSAAENANIPISNVVDAHGNTGFGRWLKVPGTTTWYFLAGDLNANGTLGTAGFVSSGLYNLSWGTLNGWYNFSATGEMQVGWQQVNGKTYYFEPSPLTAEYGKAAVGSKTINGQVYNFDANGALVQ